MRTNLDSLLLAKDKVNSAIDSRYVVELFRAHCTDGNLRRVVTLHSGTECVFDVGQVHHAFRETVELDGVLKKGSWDKARIRRMPWILPLLSGQVAHSAAYFIPAGAEKGWDKDRKIYIYMNYVVWLHRPADAWEFSTGYLVSQVRDLRKYGKFGQKILEKEMPRDKAHGARPAPGECRGHLNGLSPIENCR